MKRSSLIKKLEILHWYLSKGNKTRIRLVDLIGIYNSVPTSYYILNRILLFGIATKDDKGYYNIDMQRLKAAIEALKEG